MLICMRTTVRMDPALLKAAKKYAVEAGITLTALLEDAVREILARRRSGAGRSAVTLPTFKGTGVAPGVDLDDSASLRSVMDE